MFHAIRTIHGDPLVKYTFDVLEYFRDQPKGCKRYSRNGLRQRPRVEPLENRDLPSSLFTVTDLLDAAQQNPGSDNPQDVNGQVSLRSAIAAANVDAVSGISDTINFAAGMAGTTIALSEGVLELSGAQDGGSAPITIDASALTGGITISGANQSGVFQIDGGVIATFNALTIVNGNSSSNGGGIKTDGTLTLIGTTVSGNSATDDGGGIANRGVLTLNGVTVSGNSASTPIPVEDSTIGYGAGIYSSGTVTIINSTIAGNTGQDGGGIMCDANLTMSDSIVSGNTALDPFGRGGGIWFDGGNVTMTNCTVSSNTASYGDGIWSGALLTMTNCTVSGNGPNNGAGILNYSTLTLQNTIVAGNPSSTYPDLWNRSGMVSANYTMIGASADSGVSGGSGNILDPTTLGLGSLANNGGPTQTIALLAGSPAIDAGSNALAVDAGGNPLTTDQRGDPREVAGGSGTTTVDMGAFEFQNFDVAITGTAAPSPVQTGTNMTYTLTVSNSGLNQTLGAAFTDTLPAGVTFVSASAGYTQSAGVVNGPIAGLASGASTTITIVVQPTATGTITNTASVSTHDDPNPDNNTAAITTTVNAPALTTIGVSASLSTIPANGQGVFTVTRTIGGSTLAVTLAVDPSSTVPAGSYTLTGTNDSFSGSTGVLTVSFAPADLSETITFTPNVNNAGATGLDQTLQLDLVADNSYLVSATQGSAAITVLPSGLVVTNTNASGPGSLAQAVAEADASAAGGTIIFATAAQGGVFDTLQSIALAGPLELNNRNPGASITIEGPAAGVTIGGGGPGSDFSVFTVAANTTATLVDLSITDGYATAGGGITNESGATLTLSNDNIFGNSAAYGAAVDNHGTLAVYDTTFAGNSASSDGGGIDNEFAASLTLNNGSLSGNVAAEDGGGIENRGTLTVRGAVVSQDNAQRDGGGINNFGALVVNGSTLSENSALNGGGIDNFNTLTVSTSTLTGNFATSGGGIANFAALTVSASTLVDNSSQKDGAGIFNNGELTVINSTLTGNSAGANGGALANELAATGTLSNATVSADSAADGGGIANSSGTLVLNNTIVAGNSASTALDVAGAYAGNNHDVIGGTPYLTALLDFGGPTATMAPEPGSSVFGQGGSVTALSAAVTSSATTIAVADAAAVASTPGDYLIQVDAEQMLVTGVNLATNTLTVVRGTNNTTAAAHALQAGVSLATDQRGVSRAAAGSFPDPDIGAFQSGATLNLVVTTTAASSAGVPGQLSLPAAVNLADELSGSITITFADAPGQVFATAQTIALTGGLNLNNSSSGTSITINGPTAGVTIAGGGGSSNFSVITVAANTTATIQGLTIANGHTFSLGGGIANLGTLTVSAVTFSGDSAADGGGIDNLGTLTLTNVTFDNNSAALSGGGFHNEPGGKITAIDLTLSRNSGKFGGGIDNDSGSGVTSFALTLFNVTLLANSANVGGAIDNNGTQEINGATIEGNKASTDGGGLFENSGLLRVSGATISGNSAQDGGGIWSQDLLELVEVTVSGNSAVDGGGVYFANGGSLLGVVGNPGISISENSAKQSGGGVFIAGGAGLTISTVTISDNASSDQNNLSINGGGVFNAGTLRLTNDTISGNSTGGVLLGSGSGGAIDNTGSLTVTSTSISNNTAGGNGGGIENEGALIVSDAVFSNNDSFAGFIFGAGNGAAINNEAGASLTVVDTTITNNNAAFGGGIDNKGTALVSNSTISDNFATSNGGGIGNGGNGTVTLNNVTIFGNSTAYGGGIFTGGAASMTMEDVTISGNSATDGGGIFVQGSLTLQDSIIAGNTANPGPDIDGGITKDLGHNLLGTALRPNSLLERLLTTDVFSDQPLLAPLGDYGGPTQTLALLPGSPAIGTGGPATTVAVQITLPRFVVLRTTNITVKNAAALPSTPGGYPIVIDGLQLEVISVSNNTLTVQLPRVLRQTIFAVGDGVYLVGQSDQRGFSRQATSPDIGAFQTQGNLSLVVTTAADPVAGSAGSATGGTPGQLSLREAVNLANLMPGQNTITFASASGQAFNTPQTITLSAGLDLAKLTAGASITIQGSPAGVTIAGGGPGSNFSAFSVAANTTAALEGLTITGGTTSTNGGGIDNNGALTVSGITLSDNSAGNDGGGIDNTGVLTVSNITLTGNVAPNGSGIDNEPGGTLTVTNATVSGTPSGANVIVNAGRLVVPKDASFSAASDNYSQSTGTTTVDGTLTVADIFLDGGVLNGTGTVQGNLVNNGGTVFPGDDPGTLTVAGDYTQASSGTLEIEIGGATNYSKLAISGTATLGGTFDTTFIDGFTPGAQNSFQTLTSGQVSGNFATITGLNAGNGNALIPLLDSSDPGFYITEGQTSFSTVALQTTAGAGSTYGQNVTFTADVSSAASSSNSPGGTVQFQIDGSNFGMPIPLTDGSAGMSTAGLTAGAHAVTAIYSGDSNFLGNSAALSGGQGVTPAPLTITAVDKSMAQDSSLPPLTVSYAGFVNGDTAASLATLPRLSTAATGFSPPGIFPIIASGAADSNYKIKYVQGTLTVTPASAASLNALFVTSLYQDVLGRLPDAGGLKYWVTALNTGATHLQVAQGFWESPEHRGIEVDGFYEEFLGRRAEAAGRAFWVNELLGGMSEKTVEYHFLTSLEYNSDHPGAASFVTSLYAQLFGRSVDPAGQVWIALARTPAGRLQTAESLLTSPEMVKDVVDSFYMNLLQRPPDAAGERDWIAVLQGNPALQSAVAEQFLASPEFFERSGEGAFD